ncbi:polysaccharide deacetylase family protein [Faecalibacter bovis]|uniref:Polysaccharide deacetylase family protein n=1 Tax=Faecalibacter bovis TaxID=2898187 RepID=A0ABX7XF64_9FLAO|nr:polysaccharide deacetylase family protein [Faecalibacter bovis]QTV06459.1 polysaccharide deacetylase family protein [Faecalibacter bovis]
MNQFILIYTEKNTNRIEYIFDFICCDFLGIDFKITTDVTEFINSDLPKINFSTHFFEDEINFQIDDILVENEIRDDVNYNQLSEIGKCFYWLSRYEEYIAQQHQFDHHNRFLGSELDYSKPIVDLIVLEIQKIIQLKYPHFQFNKREFKQINTHDVDFSWKYLNKPWFETIGSIGKKVLKGNFKEIKSQIDVLSYKIKDPYDQFNYIKQLSDKYKIESIFFWLLGDKTEFDRNLNWENQAQADLIKATNQWAKVGIHPSYISNFNESSQALEIKRLEKILNKKVLISRQHFIKLNFPNTYQQLLINGIKEDYSMGFAHKTGFRAGTSTPFKWFDLSTNQQTMLITYPFVAMDVTLRNYMKLTIEDAIIELKNLKNNVKEVNGTFITLFHQSNFEDEWSDWKIVYESLFND